MSGGHRCNLILTASYPPACINAVLAAVFIMENLKGFEKITDYAWIKKGRKYWNIWVGNPFCISLHKVPLSIPKEEIEMDLVTGQQEVKRDFVKRFPDVEWVG